MAKKSIIPISTKGLQMLKLNGFRYFLNGFEVFKYEIILKNYDLEKVLQGKTEIQVKKRM